MKPRLIIHIGTDKTGTTYLQKTFSHNYENLLGQKILYLQNFNLDLLNYGTQERGSRSLATPNKKGIYKSNGLNLFFKIGCDGPKKLREILVYQCNAYDCSTVLLSNEELFKPKFNFLELFQKCKEDFDITTICLVRRPDYYVESRWAASAKKRVGRRLQIAQFLNNERYRQNAEITNNLMRWEALGPVIAANYAEGKKLGLLEYFNQKAGIPTKVNFERRIDRANASISANCASTLVRLREMGISPNVDAVVSAFRHDRGNNLALGSYLRAKLLADRKDDLTAAKSRYGLEFSDEMPEEQTDPLEGPSPTSLLQAFAALVRRRRQ